MMTTPVRIELPLTTLVLAVAGLYLLLAVTVLLWLSPTVPFADTWRFDAQLLQAPFPQGILMVDNGHAQVPSRLLRWLELNFWHGSAWPTILAGLLALLASIALWCSCAPQAGARRSAHALHNPQTMVYAAWCLTGITGLCWLGASRTLAHGNEAWHSYLIIACLFLALRLVSRQGKARLATALACAVLASLTFGTGAAVFVAIAMALLLRRAGWRTLLATTLTAAGTAIIYLLLPKGASGTGVLSFAPLVQIEQIARWLASPWLFATWPLTDTSLLPQLPGVIRVMAAPLAHLSTEFFGPARSATWPQLGFGMAGIALLLASTARAAWQRQRTTPAETLALATSWFALACGVLVVLARSDYFQQLPAQLYAPRYVVWVALFWAGLLGTVVCRLAGRGRQLTALFLVLAVALTLLPSSSWMTLLAAHRNQLATHEAMALRLGILDGDAAHGDNPVEAMRQARALLKQAQVAIFAPDSGPNYGQHWPASARTLPLEGVERRPLHNLLPYPASHVRFTLADDSDEPLLLLDEHRRVSGIAWHKQGEQWHGVLRGSPAVLQAVSP